MWSQLLVQCIACWCHSRLLWAVLSFAALKPTVLSAVTFHWKTWLTLIWNPFICSGSSMTLVFLPPVQIAWSLSGEYLAPILKTTDTGFSTSQYFWVSCLLEFSRSCLGSVRYSLVSLAACVVSLDEGVKLCSSMVIKQSTNTLNNLRIILKAYAFVSSVMEHYLWSWMNHFSAKSCFWNHLWWGWRDGLAVNTALARGPRFDPQHPRGGWELSVTPVPGELQFQENLTPSSDLLGIAWCGCTNLHTDSTFIHIKKKSPLKWFNHQPFTHKAGCASTMPPCDKRYHWLIL